MDKLVIIGASGHGKVAADIAEKMGYREIVFLDDNPNITQCAGFPVVGPVSMAPELDGDKFVAIGNNAVRQRIQSQLKTVSLIHPNAIISRRVAVGEGCVIMAGAVINSDTVIEDGCIINTCASVDHDCTVGAFSHISVGAHIAGTVKIGEKVWIGAGATVLNNLSICEGTIIGAGAVVTKNINESGTYVGIPCKQIK